MSDTQGSGTVLGIAVVMSAIVGVMLVAAVATALLTAVRLQNAADAAALAAADARRGLTEGVPCTVAAAVVEHLDVAFGACRADGEDMRVTVSGTILGFPVERGARAGPPE